MYFSLALVLVVVVSVDNIVAHIRPLEIAMMDLKCLFIWMAMDTFVASGESTNKIVSCAACQVMSSHSAWECDVKCNTAPEGTLIYGELIVHRPNLKE